MIHVCNIIFINLDYKIIILISFELFWSRKMPIPDYQTLMLPVLKCVSTQDEMKLANIVESMALEFNLTADEKKELLPSGTQPIFYNRVGWAGTYLYKAGLLEMVRRGFYKITSTGKNVLAKNPAKITRNDLMQFESFRKFQGVSEEKQQTKKTTPQETVANDKNPEETIAYIIEDFKRQLAEDLLEKIKQNSPTFFENLVASLLIKMGYGNSIQDILKNRGKSGDEGIDGIIKEDALGLDKIYIQAKKWEGTVGRPKIQEFVGAIDNKTHKGVFITTSAFSAGAIEYAAGKPSIVLIDGKQLAELMIKYNLGVSIKQAYEIKKVDEDFFSDEV